MYNANENQAMGLIGYVLSFWVAQEEGVAGDSQDVKEQNVAISRLV